MADKIDQALYRARTLMACSTSVLVYEIMTTLRYEYRYIWRSGAAGILVRILYAFTRWGALVSMILYMVTMFTYIDQLHCNKVHFLPTVFVIPSLVAGECLLILRVYALYERRIWILVLLGSLLASAFATAIWCMSSGIPLSFTIFGLPGCVDLPSFKVWRFFSVPWICLCTLDGVSAILIGVRMLAFGRDLITMPFLRVILRDATIHFTINVAVKIATTINIYLNRSNPAELMPMAVALAAMIASRALFNLKMEGEKRRAFSLHIDTYNSALHKFPPLPLVARGPQCSSI